MSQINRAEVNHLYRLSILDQSIVEPHFSNNEILQNTVKLAQSAEKWGYHRFWVSEHHASAEVLGSSPEILASYLLAKTSTIRIGTGGVLLQHYSPFKVAENFQVLATLEPGRVDVGIGKGPGGFPLSTKALQFGQINDGKDFEERFKFLIQLLRNELPEDNPYVGLEVTPKPPIPQDIILLGTSEASAKQAASLNINYTFGTTFTPNQDVWKAASKAFHEHKQGGKLIFAVAVVVADSAEKAKSLAVQRDIVKVHLENGRIVTLLDEQSARKFGEESGVPCEISIQKPYLIAGTSTEVKKKLDLLADEHGIDEFLIQTPVASFKDRYHSLELLSELNVKTNSFLVEL